MICPYCGNAVPDGAVSCPICGGAFAVPAQQVNQIILCPNCNTQLHPGAASCPTCGTQFVQQTTAQIAQVQNGAVADKKDFFKHFVDEKTRKNINTCGILSYVCAALTLVSGMLSDVGAFILIDVLILLGMGLGIQLGKSRACAIILTVYGVLSVILALVSTGRFQGWLIPVIGVYAIIYTFKFNKDWKEYKQANGIQ